ncbi:MAG: S1 family peptidase [Mycobacterium sp.]
MTVRWFRGLGLAAAAFMATTGFASPALAAAPPAPGIQVKDQAWKCTAGFAAQGDDGSYYLFTSGHCNHPEGSPWTYAQGVPLGRITASEEQADRLDVAIIRLDPGVGVPASDVSGMPVRDVLDVNQIQVGTPLCKLGAITGETCGTVTSTDGELLVASVPAKPGDSGSAGYVKNADGTVSAVGVLSGSLNDDLKTTVYVLVQPLLGRWGLRLLP